MYLYNVIQTPVRPMEIGKSQKIMVILLVFVLLTQKVKGLGYGPVEKTKGGDTNQVNILNNLSQKLINEAKLDSAILYAKLALEVSQNLNFKKGMGYAYNRIGLAYDNKGNYTEALINFQSALKIKEELGDKKGAAYTYLRIGCLYNTRENRSGALKYILNSKTLMTEIGDVEGAITCDIYIIGIYTELGKYEEAIDIYNAAIKKAKEIGNKEDISSLYINIGNIYLKKKDYKECLKNQFYALELADKTNDKYSIALSSLNISLCYKNLKDYEMAEQYGLKALNMSDEIYLIIESQKNISEIYSLTGNDSKAFKYFKSYIAVRDSFVNTENTKKTTMLEMNYQFDKKEAVAKLEQEKKDSVQKSILISVIFGLIVSLIASIVTFRSYKIKQNDNILLTKQKEELNEKNRIIEEKQKEILASIRYAKRIQTSLLPTEKYIDKSLTRLIK